ncbi:MAG: tRNA lysidine(34) synthetase TilS [Chloroflexi bacterium]|nr:tRNA lysidine(34) synthetase TilS [Chloroflexota bacterium]
MVKGQETLEQRVLHFIRQHHLLSGQHCLLVAVSGGPDSVCLLHLLVALREELKIKLHVAHLDHQLRGAESEADARYVADLAHQLGIPATIERRDVKAEQARQHTSLEEAAREVRYTFLAEVARSIGADRVAVGHTADDHIETILMHLIRGTGTRGLRGLQPNSRWQSAGNSLTIIRPLLPVSRLETADFCRNHQLMPRIDTSNLSLSPLRNRIRHQLLPLLESYNPRVAEALLRTARLAGDDLAFLDKEGARLWGKIARRQGKTIMLDKKGLLKAHAALQRHLLRTAIENVLGSLKDIEARHIEELMAALTKPAGKRISLPGGLTFAIEYTQYLLGLDSAALSPFPTIENEFDLKIPGETCFPGWRVVATIIDPSLAKEKPWETISEAGLINNLTAYLSLDKVGDEVAVRCRQPGDRFQPLGMSQPKTVGEFMIDAKIHRAWRQRVPVVASPRHILWVVGGRIDERVKVTEDTKGILRLEFLLES